MTKCELIFTSSMYDQIQSKIDIIERLGWKYILSDEHPIDDMCKHLHKHLGITLPSNRTLEDIAKLLEVKNNQIEKIKSQWKTYVVYILTHLGQDGKTVLEPKDYKTNILDLNVDELINEKKLLMRIDTLIDDIIDCKFTEFDYHKDIALVKYVTKNSSLSKMVIAAFKEQERQKYIKYNKAQNGGEEIMRKEVFWLYGDGGVGKTSYAKWYATFHGMDFFLTSGGKNMFDDYIGQPCIIIDDIDRLCSDGNFSCKDLLKLLDPYNHSYTGCRFVNKFIDAPVIIVTASINPSEFWKSCIKDNDTIKGGEYQLTRRLSGSLYFKPDKGIYIYTYDAFGYCSNLKNPIITIYPEEIKSFLKTSTRSDEELLNTLGLSIVASRVSGASVVHEDGTTYIEPIIEDLPWD